MMNPRSVLASIFILCLLLAACNVFDGLYEEGAGTDVQVLITDARAALQDGRSDDAVSYLRKAHDSAPENVEVRVELASALLSHHKIDILLIAELAHDVGVDSNVPAKRSACPDEIACNFDCASMKSVSSFSYEDSPAYLYLSDVMTVLQEVEALLGPPLKASGAEAGLRFATRSDRRMFFNALVDHIAEMLPRDKARKLAEKLLLNFGITKLSTTLSAVQEAASSHGVTLYHVHRVDGTHVIDYCGPNVEEFVTGTMCTVKESAHFTVEMLEARLENLLTEADHDSTSSGSNVLEAVHDLFDGMTSGLSTRCSE